MKTFWKKSIISIVTLMAMLTVLAAGAGCFATQPEYDEDVIWVSALDTSDFTSQASGNVMGFTVAGAYATYDGIDFGEGRDYYAFRIMAAGIYDCVGVLELRVGGIDGELVGTMDFKAPADGTWADENEYAVVVEKPELLKGVVDLCLVFKPENTYLFNYSQFWFDSGEVVAVEAVEEDPAAALPKFEGNVSTVSVNALDVSDDLTVQKQDDCVGYTVENSYAVYKGLNFGEGYEEAAFYMNAAVPATDGGMVEVRVGNAEGALIATLEIEPTGAWGNYIEKAVMIENLAPLKGNVDICLVFHPYEGTNYVCNYKDFRFEGVAAANAGSAVENTDPAPEVSTGSEGTPSAPQTADLGIIAAALIALAGYTAAKKR